MNIKSISIIAALSLIPFKSAFSIGEKIVVFSKQEEAKFLCEELRNALNQILAASFPASSPIVFSPEEEAIYLSNEVKHAVNHEQTQKENKKPSNVNNRNNNVLYKTERCDNYQAKQKCPYGEKCQYAHGEDELKQAEHNSKYKTELCDNFHNTGACKYGKRCKFAHGENDLRDENKR